MIKFAEQAGYTVTPQEPLRLLAADIAEWRQGKGFYTPANVRVNAGVPRVVSEAEYMGIKLALIHSELWEVDEAYSEFHYPSAPQIAEEWADVGIRILDVAGTMALDLDALLPNLTERVEPGDTLTDKLLQLHGLTAACTEASRKGDRERFVDALLRLWDLLCKTCVACNVDLMEEIGLKMMKNTGRPHLHGKGF